MFQALLHIVLTTHKYVSGVFRKEICWSWVGNSVCVLLYCKNFKTLLFIVENIWCEGRGMQSSVNSFSLNLLLLIKKARRNRIGRGFERSSSLSLCPWHIQLHLLCLCQYFDWALSNSFQCFPILNRLAQIFHAEVEFIASYPPWAWKTDYLFFLVAAVQIFENCYGVLSQSSFLYLDILCLFCLLLLAMDPKHLTIPLLSWALSNWSLSQGGTSNTGHNPSGKNLHHRSVRLTLDSQYDTCLSCGGEGWFFTAFQTAVCCNFQTPFCRIAT